MDAASRALLPITVAMTIAILLSQSVMIASGCYCTIADRDTIEACTLSELLPSSTYLWSFVLSFNGYHTTYCAFLLCLMICKRAANLEGFPIRVLPSHSKIPGRMIKWMVFSIWFTFLLMMGAVVWVYGFSTRDLYVTVSEMVSISANSLICWQMIAEDLDGVRIMGRTSAHHHEIVDVSANERISETANVIVQRLRRCMKLGCYGIIMHNVIYFVYDVTATPLRNGGKGEVSAYQIQINILFAIAAVFYRITCAQFIFYSI
jgi:hypothetical protein